MYSKLSGPKARRASVAVLCAVIWALAGAVCAAPAQAAPPRPDVSSPGLGTLSVGHPLSWLVFWR